MAELKRFPGCPTGEAVRTRGYKLAGSLRDSRRRPDLARRRSVGDRALLARAYESAFARAREAGDVRSIAFPAISTGVYGFPKPDAARIALTSMLAHESEYDRIVACLFDAESARVSTATSLAELRRPR